MEYYYNQVNGQKFRNNLIYTSFISKDKKTFVQHYVNDTDYHKGKNQVIDPDLMEDKWNREVKFLTLMQKEYPSLIPTIKDINVNQKKIYLEIDGVDFWQRSLDNNCLFDDVLPDWQEQMITIIQAHRTMGLYKYSMHPSSYFIVDGQLKSINYFFTYDQIEPCISIKDVESHIYSTRQDELKKHISNLGIEWDVPQPFEVLQELCWESFRTNYPSDFIDKAKCIK